MWYPSVNRDEEVFDDADRFDIRRNPNDHLSFGVGEHFCVGANLARMELRSIFGGISGGSQTFAWPTSPADCVPTSSTV